MKKNIKPEAAVSIIIFLLLSSCTFDYGDTGASDDLLPDLIMENVEYVRVRSADPIARFEAERAERYEKRGLMKLKNFSFEQYGDRGESTNASGKAGNASVYIDSGDVSMDNGVWLEVESEDIIIETEMLEWNDAQRILSSGEENEVFIYQNNGTSFIGIGLRADARWRTWEFSGSVSGTYVHEKDADDEEESSGNE